MGNIVKANCGKGKSITTAPLWQYDYGQILMIEGVELPTAYQVHFSNEPYGTSTTSIGTEDGVTIPDAYLQSGGDVYAWLYLHEGEDDGETVLTIRIPVQPRAAITNDTPTPVQQDEIDELIAALNLAVDAAEDAAAAAEDAQEAIEDMSVEASTLSAGSSATVTKTVDPGTGAVTLAFGIPKGDNGGDPTSIIDDTAGSGDTNKVLSADKVTSELSTLQSAIQAKYTKPQTGIPASDLASGVIPDVSGLYTKPSGGIPKTDLAIAVKASLDLADTALQGNDVASAVDAWCDENITNPSNPPLDRSLSSASSATPADISGSIKQQMQSYLTESAEVKYVFEQGTINGTTGVPGNSNTRCRTTTWSAFVVHKGNIVRFNLHSDYKFSIRRYTGKSSDTFVDSTDWFTSSIDSYKVVPSYYYRFVIAKKTDANVSPSDLPSNVFSYQYVELFDETLSVKGMAADAKETGNGLEAIDGIFVENESTVDGFENGTINTTDGTNGTSSTRCRTAGYTLVTESILKYTPKSGYKVNCFIYSTNSSSGYEKNVGWKTSGSIIRNVKGKYVRFNIAYTADGSIDYGNLPSDALTLTFYAPTDKTLTLDGKSADAKATGENLDALRSPYKNFFDGNITNYAFSGGKIVEGDSYRSFYWEVKNGEVYTISRASTSVCNRFRFAFTTAKPEADVPIYLPTGVQESPGSADDSKTSVTITVPANHEYKYAVVYLSNNSETIDDSSKLMINQGGITLPWERYALAGTDKKLREDIDGITSETIIKLQQVNRPNRWPASSLNTPPLVLLHFSDIHNDAGNIGRIAMYKEKYSDYIDDAIHTGDIVASVYTQGIALFDAMPDALQVIGNHDTRANNDWFGVSESDSYTNYFAPYVSNWDATITSGKCYYYKDYATKNVRLIVLDNMHQSATQLAWFADTLASAKTAGYTVVCACHMAYPGLTSMETSFNSEILTEYWDTHHTAYEETMSDDYPDAVDTFIDGGGKFACWIVGHTHFNIFAKLTNHQNQVVIAVPNAGITNANSSDADRKAGTQSQDCFNIIAIDDYSSLVKVMRVGCNYTRWMKHQNVVCWDFANKVFRS